MESSMAVAYQEYPRINQETPQRKCTPFCDKNKLCTADHHELLVAIVNCTDMLGSLSNLENLKDSVEKHLKAGWNKDDNVPDVVAENRFPLVHWAAALGKCNALEWMLASGFSAVSRSPGTGETALHKAVVMLYKSRPKFTVKELKPKFAKMAALLNETLIVKDDARGETSLHTAAGMLVNGEHKPNFFLSCIEVIVKQAKKMSHCTDAILNSVSDEGETALHVLARAEKSKIDYCVQAIRCLILNGADRSIRNNDGQTALDIALGNGSEALVEELIKVVDNTEAVPNGLGLDESSVGEIGCYSGLGTPAASPPSLLRAEGAQSPVSSMNPVCNGDDDNPLFPRITHVQSANIKVELLEDNQNPEEFGQEGMQDEEASSSHSLFAEGADSPLLKHLGEAGLLNDVSALLSRARSRDEGNLRKIQSQAKEYDAQVTTKLKEIDRMKLEVANLRVKRKRCDEQCEQLKKRLTSCDSALKEIPGSKGQK